MHTFAGGMTDAEGEILHVMTTVQAFDLVAETGMVGRGRHALRSAARMDSLQKLSVRQAADTPVSQPSSMVELVWPIAAKRRCYALLRQVRQTSVDQSRPNTPQEAPAGAVRTPPVVWPLAVKEHIRRLRRAESTGGPQQNTVKSRAMPDERVTHLVRFLRTLEFVVQTRIKRGFQLYTRELMTYRYCLCMSQAKVSLLPSVNSLLIPCDAISVASVKPYCAMYHLLGLQGSVAVGNWLAAVQH